MGRFLARSLGWLVRWMGMQTLLSLALLLTAMGSVALGLANLLRGLNPGLSLLAVTFGLLGGWLLAKSPLPGWLAAVLGFILGAETIAIRVGELGTPLTTLLQLALRRAWEALRWPFDGSPDGPALAPVWGELRANTGNLLTRVHDWALAVTTGEAAFDPLAAALVWGITLWMVAFWAGWAVRRRRQVLQGLAPAGALLAFGLAYTWDNPNRLYPLLGGTLFLLILIGQVVRESRWQAAGTDFSPELRLDLALVAVPLALALLVAAMIAPSISVRSIAKSAQRLLEEHLGSGKQVADSVGLEPLAGSGVAGLFPSPGLPNQNLIGSGPELAEQVVMRVSTGDAPPDPLDITYDLSSPQYYWRGLTYDEYTGRGWRTGEMETIKYRAGAPAIYGAEPKEGTTMAPSARRTIRQEVQMVEDFGGLLYRAGQLVTADQDFMVSWRSPDDAFGAKIDATVYRADSQVSAASASQLRASGDNYPEWLLDRYLSLPAGVPARVLSLARNLTQDKPTPYDQALAIETYVRTFTYTLDLPAPPPNRDVADYFLFDLKQGYCDYYATSMVVLARAAGLPARIVVGYFSGTYSVQNAHYVINAADAHTWVEIFFPGYGWIEFEPTGGRPSIARPDQATAIEFPEPLTTLKPRASLWAKPSQLLRLVLLSALFSLSVGGLAWWATIGWRLRRLSPAVVVTTVCRQLQRYGKRLDVPTKKGDTPYEFAEALTERVIELSDKRPPDAALVAMSEQVRWLTDLQVRGLYSSRAPNATEKDQTIRTWRKLCHTLWRAWILQRRRHFTRET